MFDSGVTEIAAYLREVTKLQERFKNDDLWFRGESSKFKNTRLVPKAYRSRRSTEDLLETEFDLWSDFNRYAPQLANIVPSEDFEWYFLMQHHRVPTRLLDWSDGSLIALHFAVSNRTDENDRLVYVLDPAWLDDQLPKPPDDDDARDDFFDSYLPMDAVRRRRIPLPEEPLSLSSTHFVRRIAAQRSRFILFGRGRLWLSERYNTGRCRHRRNPNRWQSGSGHEERSQNLRYNGVGHFPGS